jgi:hypothetical protein
MKASNTLTPKGTLAPKGSVTGFWIATALFCLEMSFTAYYELANAGVGKNFARLGFRTTRSTSS